MSPRRIPSRIAILVVLALGAAEAWAIPTLSIDLDTVTPGVQATGTVLLGSTVDVAIVLTGDGVAAFDTAVLDLAFDPAVVGVAPGGDPVAGGLAATAPIAAADVFGGGLVGPDDPLTPLSPSPNSLGGVGLTSLGVPFPVVGSGLDVTVALLSFETLGVGQTSLTLGPVLPQNPVLALFGDGVGVALESAFLNVRSSQDVPEPHGLLLVSLGLALVHRIRSRR